MTDETDRTEAGRFQPGVSGNPAGRPKGSRNKLAEDFVGALQADFAANGEVAISAARAESPATYLKVIASVIPKDVKITHAHEGMSLAELDAVIEFVRAQLDGGAGGADGAAGPEGG